MNCLELFKSNSYFGNYIKSDLRNHLITQDDNTPSTYQTDIKMFYREIVLKNKYEKDYFDLIIAYPPETATETELETLFEILEYYKEGNPNMKYIILRTISLHKYILKHKKEYHNHKVFDSCKYGFDYKQETILFTNIIIEPKRCMDKCENMITDKYLNYSKHVSNPPIKYIMPPQLIYEVLRHL
jgi:hypothetical protein